ncbi:serine/threonine-protein kinase [Streptomyces cyaneofuscatus]|uniref:serine/threonine-protein kinase n=1 Tax=Streptomyces cyaneofuscatus TaxID=66883 RepID=UPI00366067BC
MPTPGIPAPTDRLLSRLGHAGMGTVWRAHDQVVDRDAAAPADDPVAQVVRDAGLLDGEREHTTAHQRRRVEARSAARIDHPSVVTIHDLVVEEGRPWIVMELVRGQSLGDRLQEGILDTREAARIGLAVLDALAAAHDAGVLHRDVKPDSVLLGTADRVVLTDFGIAQVEGEQRLTETGAFVGSPEYIAPERVLGQHPGPASDLWSLGVVLALVVVLVNPFAGDGPPEGWQVRPENEVLSADVAVPTEYKRVQEDNGELVRYADPSGVFEIDFWHRTLKGEDGTDSDNPGADAAARKAYYEGGADTMQMEDASVTYKKVTHQGRPAVEMITDYIPYASSSEDDPVRYRFHELLIPGGKPSDPYWHVRVRMPAEGQAVKDGATISTEVTGGLKIHDS